MRALRGGLKEDRVRTRILHLTPLGLVEMTRKRTGESLGEMLTGPCPTCEGRGQLLSPYSVAVQVETQLQKIVAKNKPQAILVAVHPRVALTLIGEHGDMAQRLEKRFGVPIYVRCEEAMHPERFRIEPGRQRLIERQFHPFKPGQTIEILPRHIVPQQQERHLVTVDGYTVEVEQELPAGAEVHKVRLDEVHHSWALASLVYSAGNGDERKRRNDS
jgi:ribonuclease G